MIDRNYRMRSAASGLGMLVALALVLTAGLGAATAAKAQANGGIVIGATISCNNATECGPEYNVEVTVTTEDGEFLGTCTVTGNVLDQSHVPACAVDFPFRPSGTLIVTEDVSTLPAGYAPVEDLIHVDSTQLGRASHDVIFQNVPQSQSVSTGQTSDVAIATTESGRSATDVCYVLVDFSNEGCDRNGDGQVTFEDVPFGTYTVRQTADLGPGRWVEDYTIQITGNMQNGWEVFSTTVNAASGGSVAQPSLSGAIDISLITRDPDTGNLLTGTCYVLVGYSNEGCDENGDGQVTFAAIPYGAYTVHQTRTPAGYPAINDYIIDVQPLENLPGGGVLEVPLGFIVKQAPDQNAPDTRNVSVVLIDVATGEKVVADVCVELVGASNIGCDDGLADGQIDFLDVPAGGAYELRFTNLPAGFEIEAAGGPLSLSIDAEPSAPSIRMIFVLLTSPR